MYNQKFMQYEQRAKQIKKQVIDVQNQPPPQDNSGQGGAASGAVAAKPKDKTK